jgi:hypothetical protein
MVAVMSVMCSLQSLWLPYEFFLKRASLHPLSLQTPCIFMCYVGTSSSSNRR